MSAGVPNETHADIVVSFATWFLCFTADVEPEMYFTALFSATMEIWHEQFWLSTMIN